MVSEELLSESDELENMTKNHLYNMIKGLFKNERGGRVPLSYFFNL